MQVDPDTEGFAEKLQADVDEAVAGVEAKVRISADIDQAKADIDEIKADLDELDSKEASPEVLLGKDQFDAGYNDAKAKLDELDEKHAVAELGLDKDDFDAEADDAEARIASLDGERAEPTLGLDDSEFQEKLAQDKAEMASAGAGGGESGSGSLIAALSLGAGAVMPGVSTAVAGMGLLAGTGALAFEGVGKALEAHSQAAQNVGITSAQAARTSFQNSVQIQQAQLAVGQASQQAAEDSSSSAAQVEQAQISLSSAVRSAAAAQVQALQQVEQAQQGVQEADYNLSEAQYGLSQAWVQAREQITQLDDALNDSKLSVQAASLAVQQAEYNQTLVDQNAYSTSLDRQAATLAVAQAKQQLTDATDQESAAQYAATLADKQGVAGSQTVIQAKQGVTQAQYAQTNAQQQYADAQTNLTNTELNNAAQIQAAQLALSQAQQQAAYTAQRDAVAVAQAQQNLTNTYTEQGLAQASLMSTSNQAANQFAKDMTRLSPAGRTMVKQLLNMTGAFQGLETAAQTAIAPGIVTFLAGLQKIMPIVSTGVSGMATAMGTAFGEFGKVMQTPAFSQGLQGLITNGIQFTNIVLPAFAQFLQMMGQLGGSKGAASGLANLLAGIARGLTGLAAGLKPSIGPINQFLTAAGVIIAQIGPPLAQIIGLVARALGPLTSYLDHHPNGLLAKALGDIVAGLLAVKGLQKILPNFVVEPMEKLVSRAGKWGAGIAKNLTAPIFSGVKSLASSVGSSLAGAFSSAWSSIASFGSSVGSMMASAASSVASFAATVGRQLAAATVATVTWVAEHAAATASFVAENVAQIASATAAFIAENLATLGIAAGIALLIAGIILLATHWSEVMGDIKNWSLDLWHKVLDPMWQGISAGAMWLWHEAIAPVAQGIEEQFKLIEAAALFMWHEVFDPLWQALESGASGFVSAFRTVWGGLETVFKAPVNFLIGTVYDKGIARLWDDVVGAIGMGSLKLPVIPTLAGGGIVPGHDQGHDSQLVMMRPGEGVLQPGAVNAIGGPGAVHALNQQHGDKPAGGGGAIAKMAVKLPAKEAVRRTTERPALHLLGFQGGGVLGDIGGFISGAVSGALNVGKMVAAIATGNTAAFTNAAAAMIGTHAAGDLAKIMTGIPHALVSDLAQALTGGGLGGGISSPGHVTGTVAQWFAQAVKLAGVPTSWIPDLETIAHYESSDNPNAINLSDSNAAAGDPSRGIMQTIMGTFLAYHQPGTSMNIYDPVANIAAAIRYIKSRYGTVGNVPGIVSLSHGGGYVGYDSGGWLMPGGMIPSNSTGQPEAVLTPEESAAFVAIAKRLTAQGTGTFAPVNQFIYNGPQVPSPEMRAMQMRDLAMTLSGHSS